MSLTYSQLLTKITESKAVTVALEVLRVAGFKVSDWSSTSDARALVNVFGRLVSDASVSVQEIAKNLFVPTSTGAWLDRLGEDNYDEPRKAAVATRRTLRLHNNTGSLYVLDPGAVLVRSTARREFRNINGSPENIADGATLDVEWEAVETGAAYNASSSSWELSTPVAGLTVSEPIADITRTGADVESDAEYQTRLTLKWASTDQGNDDFYAYWSLTNWAEVRKVKVLAANNGGTPTPGWVTVYLGGASGGVSAAVVDEVQEFFDPTDHLGRAPSCVRVLVESMVTATVQVSGTVYARAAEKDAAKAKFESDLEKYRASLGSGAKVSRERIVALIMGALTYDEANDLELSQPATDNVLSANQVPSFDLSGLTWVAS